MLEYYSKLVEVSYLANTSKSTTNALGEVNTSGTPPLI